MSDRVAEALAALEAAEKEATVVSALRRRALFRSPVYVGSTDCGHCVACRVRAALAAFDEVEGP